MSLVDGPFDHLEGRWDFTPIGGTGTRADLQVRFATHGVIGALALGPAFEGICNHLVDAFARRARQVFGGAERIAIEVACAEAERQTVLALEVPAGCTAGEAIERSGIFALHPALDPAACGVGIFGREVAARPRARGRGPCRGAAAAGGRSARAPAAAGARRAAR